MSSDSGITLQINLSPGDLAYARHTVPRLVLAHQSGIVEKLAIVDCCRPQRSKFVDPDQRFPEGPFYQRVEAISLLAEEFRRAGHFDRVEYIRPGSALIKELSEKYLAGAVRETHDAGACGLMSYLAALALTRTRYVLHYDADMVLHQDPGYQWTAEASARLDELPQAISASPRISPPFAGEGGQADAPSLHEGRPLSVTRGGWLNDWFSTRCFLMDLEKLSGYLPLLQGKELWATRAKGVLASRPLPVEWKSNPLAEIRQGSPPWPTIGRIPAHLLWRASPVHPLSPELMLFRRLAPAGGRCLQLASGRAWLLHPATKPARLVELLPAILDAVAAGKVPEAQRGWADIHLAAWEEYLG